MYEQPKDRCQAQKTIYNTLESFTFLSKIYLFSLFLQLQQLYLKKKKKSLWIGGRVGASRDCVSAEQMCVEID